MSMPRLRLHLTARGTALEVRATTTIGEGRAESRLPAEDPLSLLLAPEQTPATRAALSRLGRSLYAALMAGDVAELAADLLDMAARAGRAAEFELRFDADQVDLAAFPWELIADAEGRFLVRDGLVDVIRSVGYPTAPPAGPAPDGPLLRAIAATDEAGYDLPLERLATLADATSEQLQRALLMDQLNPWGVQLDASVALARRCGACEALNQPAARFCRSCGASLVTARRASALAFRRDRAAEWVGAEELGALLYNAGVRLAVVMAAGPVRVEEQRAFAGLAPALLLAGAPAVVCAQSPVRARFADRFNRAFYRALQADGDLVSAMRAARQALARGDWYVPALYLRHGPVETGGTASADDSRRIDAVAPSAVCVGHTFLAKLGIRRPALAPRPEGELHHPAAPSAVAAGSQLELDPAPERPLSRGAVEVRLESPSCDVVPASVSLFVDEQVDAPPAIFTVRPRHGGDIPLRFSLYQDGARVASLTHVVRASDDTPVSVVRPVRIGRSIPYDGYGAVVGAGVLDEEELQELALRTIALGQPIVAETREESPPAPLAGDRSSEQIVDGAPEVVGVETDVRAASPELPAEDESSTLRFALPPSKERGEGGDLVSFSLADLGLGEDEAGTSARREPLAQDFAGETPAPFTLEELGLTEEEIDALWSDAAAGSGPHDAPVLRGAEMAVNGDSTILRDAVPAGEAAGPPAEVEREARADDETLAEELEVPPAGEVAGPPAELTVDVRPFTLRDIGLTDEELAALGLDYPVEESPAVEPPPAPETASPAVARETSPAGGPSEAPDEAALPARVDADVSWLPALEPEGSSMRAERPPAAPTEAGEDSEPGLLDWMIEPSGEPATAAPEAPADAPVRAWLTSWKPEPQQESVAETAAPAAESLPDWMRAEPHGGDEGAGPAWLPSGGEAGSAPEPAAGAGLPSWLIEMDETGAMPAAPPAPAEESTAAARGALESLTGELLAERRMLSYLLLQQAKSAPGASSGIAMEIGATRARIAEAKSRLRALGAQVEDEAADGELVQDQPSAAPQLPVVDRRATTPLDERELWAAQAAREAGDVVGAVELFDEDDRREHVPATAAAGTAPSSGDPAVDTLVLEEMLRLRRRKIMEIARWQAQRSTPDPRMQRDIEERQIEIARIKSDLRARGITVDDLPQDEPSPAAIAAELRRQAFGGDPAAPAATVSRKGRSDGQSLPIWLLIMLLIVLLGAIVFLVYFWPSS